MGYKVSIPTHQIGDICPACSGCSDIDKGGRLQGKVSKFNDDFGNVKIRLTCSRAPLCKYTVGSRKTKQPKHVDGYKGALVTSALAESFIRMRTSNPRGTNVNKVSRQVKQYRLHRV